MSDRTACLGDLCDFVGVQVDPTDSKDDVYVGLEHVAPGRFVCGEMGRSGDVQSAKYSFRPGDVLYGKLRPYLDKAVLASDSGICTTELLVLRPRAGVDPRFLVSVVHSPEFVAHAVAGTTGSQHPRTSWNHIRDFRLPAFSQNDQSKIAAVLWRVHDAIATNDSLIVHGETLKQAAMTTLFSRGLKRSALRESHCGLIPGQWRECRLADHFVVASGGTPNRGKPEYWQHGTIPWVKTGEINYSVIMQTEEHITPDGLAGSSARLFPAGTLVMAMFGQGVTRGRVGFLGIEATCNQACAAIQPADDVIEMRFLYHFLTWRYEAIRSLAHGGQQQNLNLEIVRNLPVVYPACNDEQQEIAGILDAIDRKIEAHRRKASLLEDLFKSLLRGLISGAFGDPFLDDASVSAVTAAAKVMT
jgi:type I restriction enzyme S subunit